MPQTLRTLTVNEVAEALQLHPYTVRRLSRERKVPAFKIGGQWRYNRERIENLLKMSKVKVVRGS